MIKRIFFAITAGFKHREQIRAYLQDPNKQTENIFNLSPQELKNKGISILVLDFDGVLAAYGAQKLDARVRQWLTDCVQVFGTENVYVLSNKPNRERQVMLESLRVKLAQVPQKKPFPDGLLQISKDRNLAPSDILLVDDRLLTGILASILAGNQAILVTNPIKNFLHYPIHECFFMFLRGAEKFLFKF